MTLRDLQNTLADLARFADASGGKKGGADIRTISGLLAGGGDLPAEKAIEELSSLIEEFKQEIRQAYTERLTLAATRFDEFEPVFAELTANKLMDKDDMDKIAHAYIGARATYRSRKAALDAIKDRFEERVYQASKMKIVERYKVG
jgi:hypothetical protein